MKLLGWLRFGRKKQKLLPPAQDTEAESANNASTNSPPNNKHMHPARDTDSAPAGMALPPEFIFLEALIAFRMDHYFPSGTTASRPVFPATDQWQLPLGSFIEKHHLSEEEATLLLIGLAPHLQADLFDRAIESKLKNAGDFPKIGGVRGKSSRSFLPTGETALFLLAEGNWKDRQRVQQLFWPDHFFARKKILWLEEPEQGEPALSGRIVMSPDYVDTFLYGKAIAPHFSLTFPARLIRTDLNWDSLVIPQDLREQIAELQTWVSYNNQLMHQWGMQGRLRNGFRALFFGPAGTGKTFTAGLLGKYTGKEVYKVDLSMVVSKYIGETEKHLELLFARAEDKEWILFFDEADALFGKRTNVRDAHDKYANQEVSYLLQRIEDYNGLVILATNMKNNIDDAFLRRFNAVLRFPFPDAEQRALIWKKSFPKGVLFRRSPLTPTPLAGPGEEAVNIPEAVKKYELTGGSINNVVHYVGLKAIERRTALQTVQPQHFSEKDQVEIAIEEEEPLVIYLSDVLDGIRRELTKEGRPFSL